MTILIKEKIKCPCCNELIEVTIPVYAQVSDYGKVTIIRDEDTSIKIEKPKRCTEKCEFCRSQCCFVGEHDNHYCYGHSEVEEATR